jgi:hypothetical protein
MRMNNIRTKELYSSPNGDRWYLCREGSGQLFIAHHANLPSGGQISRIELADFLSRGCGPEQQSLLQLIGTLMDETPGELVGGEVDPGLSRKGGGGHA